MKSSTYYFHVKTKILADFQICIFKSCTFKFPGAYIFIHYILKFIKCIRFCLDKNYGSDKIVLSISNHIDIYIQTNKQTCTTTKLTKLTLPKKHINNNHVLLNHIDQTWHQKEQGLYFTQCF